jgi:hypothetical protein
VDHAPTVPKDVLPLVHLLLLVTEAHSLIYFVAFTFILGLCLEEYIFLSSFIVVYFVKSQLMSLFRLAIFEIESFMFLHVFMIRMHMQGKPRGEVNHTTHC